MHSGVRLGPLAANRSPPLEFVALGCAVAKGLMYCSGRPDWLQTNAMTQKPPEPRQPPSSAIRWANLPPDPSIVDALDHAGPRPEEGNQDEKRHWSEQFADACAYAFSRELSKSKLLKGKRITPTSISEGTEEIVFLGAGTSKQIDVTVIDEVLGLQIGITLKGLNFRDKKGQFDKNLTGRTYEMSDEIRLVHEYLPRAWMTGVFFLPLASTADKTFRADSSFARTVITMRGRTGRLDASLGGQASRCDSAYVGLYTLGHEWPGAPRGAVRFINVMTDPPRRGRPKVESTLSLARAAEQIVAEATFAGSASWAEPELDDESVQLALPELGESSASDNVEDQPEA
jgi:hypothetical protein